MRGVGGVGGGEGRRGLRWGGGGSGQISPSKPRLRYNWNGAFGWRQVVRALSAAACMHVHRRHLILMACRKFGVTTPDIKAGEREEEREREGRERKKERKGEKQEKSAHESFFWFKDISSFSQHHFFLFRWDFINKFLQLHCLLPKWRTMAALNLALNFTFGLEMEMEMETCAWELELPAELLHQSKWQWLKSAFCCSKSTLRLTVAC